MLYRANLYIEIEDIQLLKRDNNAESYFDSQREKKALYEKKKRHNWKVSVGPSWSTWKPQHDNNVHQTFKDT